MPEVAALRAVLTLDNRQFQQAAKQSDQTMNALAESGKEAAENLSAVSGAAKTAARSLGTLDKSGDTSTRAMRAFDAANRAASGRLRGESRAALGTFTRATGEAGTAQGKMTRTVLDSIRAHKGAGAATDAGRGSLAKFAQQATETATRTARLATGAKESFTGIARGASSMAGVVTTALGSFGGNLLTSFVGQLQNAGKAGFAGAVALDSMTRSLTSTMGSAAAARKELALLRVEAKNPGLGFAEAVQGSVRLQSAGLSARQSRSLMGGVGRAVAQSGGSKEDFAEVLRQVTQIRGAGKVTEENLGVIKERVPAISKALQSALGTSTAEGIREKGIDGVKFINVLEAALGRIPKTATGAKNSIDNFGDAWNRATTGLASSVLPVVMKNLDALAPRVEAFAVKIEAMAPRIEAGLKSAIAFISPIAQSIYDFVTGTAERFRKEWPGIQKSARDAFAPIKPLVSDVVTFFRENMPLMAQTVRTVLQTIGEFWRAHGKEIVQVLRAMFAVVSGIVKFAMQAINGDFTGAATTILGVFKSLGTGVVALWKLQFSLMRDIATRWGTAVRNEIAQFGLQFGLQFATAIGNTAQAVKQAAAGLVERAKEGVQAGLASARDTILNSGGSLGGLIALGARKALQIQSPSRVMQGVGAFAAAGLVIGLNSGAAAAFAAGAGLGKAAHKGAKTELEKQQGAYAKYVATATAQNAKLRAALKSGLPTSGAQTAGKFYLLGKDQQANVAAIARDQAALNQSIGSEKRLAEAYAKTNAELRERAALGKQGNLSGLDRFALNYPGANRDRIARQYAASQTNAGQKQAAEQQQSLLATLKSRYADMQGELIRVTNARQLANAQTEQERLAITETGFAYKTLTGEVKRYIDLMAGVAVQTKQANAANRQAAQDMKDAITSAKTWAALVGWANSQASKGFSDFAKSGAKLGTAASKPSLLEFGPPAPTAAQRTAQAAALLRRSEEAREKLSRRVDLVAAPFGDAARASMDAVLSGNGRRWGRVLSDSLTGSLKSSISDLFGNSVQSIIKRALQPMFDGFGRQVAGSINGSLGGVNHSLRAAAMTAANIAQMTYALMNVSGANGKKRQRGSILGGIAGGIIGSFVPGGWALGAKIGSSLGGAIAGGNGGEIIGAGLAAAGSAQGGGFFGNGKGSIQNSGYSLNAGQGGSWQENTGGGRAAAGAAPVTVNWNQYGTINREADEKRILEAMRRKLQSDLTKPG